MVKRCKTRSQAAAVLAPVQRSAPFFGRPHLNAEEAADYDRFLVEISAAVNPRDFIEEMLVADAVFLEWDLLRYRRMKSSVMTLCRRGALEEFLCEHVEPEQSQKEFEHLLTATLEKYHPEDEAQELARGYVLEEQEAIDRVFSIAEQNRFAIASIRDEARIARGKKLAREFALGDARAVKDVKKLLVSAGLTLDMLLTKGLMPDSYGSEYLTTLERIDRLIAIAEVRRNASRREIDRHRTTLGAAMGRIIEDVESGECQVIASGPAPGKKAA